MHLEHDTISKKDIPAILRRSVSIARIHDYPTGDFMCPTVDGKYIFNNTGSPLYITTSDGFVTKIESLSSMDRECVLRQLYFSLGINSKYEDEGKSPSTRRMLSLEPIPLFVSKLRSVNKERFRSFSKFKFPETYVQVPMFTEKFDDIPLEDQVNYRDIQRELLRDCSAMDSKNTLTYGLRHNQRSVWIMKPMFAEERIYGDDYPKATKSSIYNHSARLQRDTELFETNFVLEGNNTDYINGEELIAKRIPSILWNEYSLKEIANTVQGRLIQEYGFTISDTTEVRNKALAYNDADSDEYMARTGLRILIPGRVGRTGLVYARLGKYVSRIKTTQNPNLHGKEAIVYAYNQLGEEIIIGTAPIKDLLSKGIDLNLPDGNHWHIPFFESNTDALLYNDEDIQKQLDAKDVVITALTKEKDLIIKEKEKIEKDLDKMKGDKGKTFSNFIGLVIKNPAVSTFLIGLVTAVITTIVKLVF